jgi:hypothetical protein
VGDGLACSQVRKALNNAIHGFVTQGHQENRFPVSCRITHSTMTDPGGAAVRHGNAELTRVS